MDFGQAPAQGTIALIVVTALIGTLIGAFGKKAADALLAILLLAPIRAVGKRLYNWIAPRNPFSVSVRVYRRHVLRSNLARMENPVGPGLDVPLETAFAPLKLSSSTAQSDIYSFLTSLKTGAA